MRINFLTIALAALLLSCGNMTKNFVKKGDALIKGGTAGNESWNESLKFQRISWYSELNLIYDAFLTKIEKDSHFWQWFSKNEQRRLNKCKNVYVLISFSLDSDRISHAMFTNQILRDGLSAVVTNDFDLALSNHPDYNKFFLSLYKTKTLCGTRDIGDIEIAFPNFRTRKLHF